MPAHPVYLLIIGRVRFSFYALQLFNSVPEISTAPTNLVPFFTDTDPKQTGGISVSICDPKQFDGNVLTVSIQQTDLGSLLYRSERVFTIKHFPGNDNTRPPDWITVYDTLTSQARVYTDFQSLEPGRRVFPTVGKYPHIQFLLTAYLALHDGCLHHCACGIHKGRAYLFAGRSGIGKSTISRLLHGSGEFQMIGDDRIVTRRTEQSFTAHGTPWPSTAGFAENASAPLGGVFFLHQSTINTIESITPGAAFKQLLPVSDVPWYDQTLMDGILNYCGLLAESIPAWNLSFRPDPDIVGEVLKRID